MAKSREVEITKIVDQVIDVDHPLKDDIVEIQSPPVASGIAEHTYKTAFKLKSMKLYQLTPGLNWKQIRELTGLYMSKIAFNPECTRVYIIGGAKDPKSKTTVNDVNVLTIGEQGVLQSQALNPMLDNRASFGCLYTPKSSEIYAVGGYINGKLTTKCEKYSVLGNCWSPLPELNEPKASSSACLMNDRYLYCFGGLSRNMQGQAFLNNAIETIDLKSDFAKWEKLNLSLPIHGCDIGCVPIKSDEILVFGGWNKTAQKQAYIVKRQQGGLFSMPSHDINLTNNSSVLESPDFFLVNGIAIHTPTNPSLIKIAGHSHIFTFNTATKQFQC